MAQAIRPVMLVILDGFGWREDSADNAVRQARKPNFDRLWQNCPHAFLRTSGHDVGLPDGQMGNSEVGHLNIGAGRVVMQELPRISQAAAGRQPRPRAGAGRADREAEGIRRHLPSDGPGVAGRRALAPGPRGRAGQDPARGRREDRRPRVHRWPRHAAALGRDDLTLAAARRCRMTCRSPRCRAAITRWIATSAGTASARRMPRSPTPMAPHFADAAQGDGRRLRARRDRRIRHPRRASATTKACRTATASCASTSAPTACAKFSPRCSSRSSTVSRASASSGSPPPPA